MDSRIPARAVLFTKAEEDMAVVVNSYVGNSEEEHTAPLCGSRNSAEIITEDEDQVVECITNENITMDENAVDFEIIDQPKLKLSDMNLLPLPSHGDIIIDPESDLETGEDDVQVLKNPKIDAEVQTVFSMDQFFVQEASEKLPILEDLMKTVACAYTEGRHKDPTITVGLEIKELSKAEEDQHGQSSFNENFLPALGQIENVSNIDGVGPRPAIEHAELKTKEMATEEAVNDKKSSEEPVVEPSPGELNQTLKPDVVSDAKDIGVAESSSNLCTPTSNTEEEPSTPSVTTTKKKKKNKKAGLTSSPPATVAPDVPKEAQAASTRGYSLCMKVTPVLSYLEEHYFHRPLTMIEMDIFLAKMSAAASGRPWCKKCGGVDHDTSEKPNEEVLCWSLPGMTPFFMKKSSEFCKELVKLGKSINFATIEQKLKTVHGEDVFGPAQAFERCAKSPLKSMALKPSDMKLFAEFMSQNGKKKSGSRRW